MPKKGGLGQFADLRGGLGKKEGGWCFLGRGLIHRCTQCLICQGDSGQSFKFVASLKDIIYMVSKF